MKRFALLGMVLMICLGISACASLPPMKGSEFKTQKEKLFAQYPSYRIDDKIHKLGIIGNGPGRSMISTQLSRALLSRTHIKLVDPGEIELLLEGKTVNYEEGPTEAQVKVLSERFQVDHILIFNDFTSPHGDYILGGGAFDRIDLKIVNIYTGDVIFQTSSYFGLTFVDPRVYGYNSVQEVAPAEFDSFRMMNFYNLIFQLLYAVGEVQLGIIPKSPQGPYIVFDVLVGSPAEVVGIQREDRIIEINGMPIRKMEDVMAKRMEINLKQGEKASLKINRQGETKNLELNFPLIPYDAESKSTTSANDQPISFGHDFHAAGITLFSTEGEVIEILGEPAERREKEGDRYSVTLQYPFGSIELEGINQGGLQGAGDQTYVIRVLITAPGVYGPRMTRVGDDINSILRKFPDEKHSIQNKQRKLYGEPFKDISSGIVEYDPEGKISNVSFYHGKGSSLLHWLKYKAVNEKVSEIDVGVQTN
jgi:hypothetical protein